MSLCPLLLPQYHLLRVTGINHVSSVFCWGLVCAKIPKQKLDTVGISSFEEKSFKWIEKNGNAEGKERRKTKWKSTWIRNLRNVKYEFIDCLTLEFFIQIPPHIPLSNWQSSMSYYLTEYFQMIYKILDLSIP